ncbi:hypothetical protein, partial [Ruegeria sp. PrR005]
HNPKSINRGGSLLDEKPGSLLGGNQQSLTLPGQGIVLELEEALTAMIGLAQNDKSRPMAACSEEVVAGGRNRRSRTELRCLV